MSRYRLTINARNDLKDINRFIAQNNPAAARRFQEKIKQQCQTLAKFPNMGRRRDELVPGLQSFPVDGLFDILSPG